MVGSLKNYENLHDLGALWRLPYCVSVWGRGHARIQEFLCQKTALTTFLVLNFTEGAQWLFQTKLYMYIFFFFFFFWGGGGVGGGVQMLISIETHITYDLPGGSGPPTPSGSAHGETVRVRMPIFWAFVACKCDKYTDASCLERRLQWANDQL